MALAPSQPAHQVPADNKDKGFAGGPVACVKALHLGLEGAADRFVGSATLAAPPGSAPPSTTWHPARHQPPLVRQRAVGQARPRPRHEHTTNSPVLTSMLVLVVVLTMLSRSSSASA
jgi:hypothetical protein